jgi:hypothetical protein
MPRLNLPNQTKDAESTVGQELGKIKELLQDEDNHSASQTGAEYLLSIAGMFASATTNTSENVETIVSDFVLKKFGKKPSRI